MDALRSAKDSSPNLPQQRHAPASFRFFSLLLLLPFFILPPLFFHHKPHCFLFCSLGLMQEQTSPPFSQKVQRCVQAE